MIASLVPKAFAYFALMYAMTTTPSMFHQSGFLLMVT